MPFRFSLHARGVAQRAGWSVVDQCLSAVSNVVLSILVARTGDANAFGAFAVAFLVFSLLVAFTRATVGQPLQITFSSSPAHEFRGAVRSALGASLLIAVAAGVISLIVGALIGGATGNALTVLAFCLPGLLLQDTARMAFFSSGRADRAAATDGLWAVVQFAALAIVLAEHMHDVRVPIAAWGGGSLIAAVASMRMLRCSPRLRGALTWYLGQRHLTGYLLAEYVLGQGLGQVGILMVGVLGSTAGVGALRAAQVLLGPLGILGTAAFMFAVPEVARRPRMAARERGRFMLGISTAMAAVTAVYAAAILLIPEPVGEHLFGDTWRGAESVLLPMCVLSLAAALATGPAATLYGMGLARTTFRINIAKAPLLAVLLLVGITMAEAEGAAWAIAATEVVVVPLWFFRVRRAIRAAASAAPQVPAQPDGERTDSVAAPPRLDSPL